MRATSATAPALLPMFEGLSLAASRVAATEYTERKIAVAVAIAVEEAALADHR
jgi:hypothetical protein